MTTARVSGSMVPMHPLSSPATVMVTKAPAAWRTAGGTRSRSGGSGDRPAKPARTPASARSSRHCLSSSPKPNVCVLTEDECSISHHSLSVTGGVAGGAEVDQLDRKRPGLGGHQQTPQRVGATGVVGADVAGAAGHDGGCRAGVDLRRRSVIVVVTEIGTHDDERFRSTPDLVEDHSHVLRP